MLLVDTSVWIDHLRRSDQTLVGALEAGEVGCHESVIEELASGSLKDRGRVLESLASLARFPRLTHEEVLWLINSNRLWSRGLSAVDVHLLGATRLVVGGRLWTHDRRLHAAAIDLGIAR